MNRPKSLKSLKLKHKNRVLGAIFGLLVFMMTLTPLGGILRPVEKMMGAAETTGVKEVYAEPEASASSCKGSLGSLGWLVCPATGKISEAVDFLYDRIEGILEINPVKAEDGAPIYEIWKYFQGVSNIVFIIFLLVVVYSQITGVGITNYGVKKALPKLIIAAILVNLSFYICSLAVDVSNIFGESLRGLFNSIEYAAGAGEGGVTGVKLSEMYGALAGGTAIAIGGVMVAFETGAIWMLIPLALGALVSVVIGLITIALRQAVVTLLIMIAPLGMVAYILPNTEQWFKKWKQLLFQMLIFYPAFSLLFGASSVAGWAIIVSSGSGFGVLIGIAVQIFPLFFSWSLMKMSGTFLSSINAQLAKWASGPVAGVRGWAGSHRDLTRAKNLASPNTYSPSLRLQQFLSDRKMARDEETKEHSETVKNRGLAYAAMRNYKRDGETPSQEGEEAYEEQARNLEYQQQILRHKNNMNKGLGQLAAVTQENDEDSPTVKATKRAQRARLTALDAANVRASDKLKMEQARGEIIDYGNAVGFHNRMEAAINAHMDTLHGEIVNAETGRTVVNPQYKRHFEMGSVQEAQAQARYADINMIMEGNAYDAQYAAATAAHARDSQQKIHDTRMNKYAELLPPTRDVQYRLDELIQQVNAEGKNISTQNIDAIISFMRVLNQRGDTDLVTHGLYEIMDHGLELGTHASQAVASFMMFEVKDADPFLRRMGKYINLETANVFNKNTRKNTFVDMKEYVTGQYMEEDVNSPTGMVVRYSKRPMSILMEGTSLDGIERTAMPNGDEMMMRAYTENGHLDLQKYFAKRDQIDTAMGPQFISASLKYLSGSEQLKSAVKYKTGYGTEMMKIDGPNGQKITATDANGDPIYEWVAVWDKDDSPFRENRAYAKEYYRSHTIKYLTDQTPVQILGLRSDYYDGLREHLADTFEMNNYDNLTDEQKQAWSEYEEERARIQTKYGDSPIGEAKRKRDAELKKARHKVAGVQFRKMLDEKGTLEQIYRSRRSGAANNAKPWVRDWLGLDDEVSIRVYEDEKRAKRRKERQELERSIKEMKRRNEGAFDADSSDEAIVDALRPYNKQARDEFEDEINNIYDDLRNSDDDREFYEQSLEYLISVLTADNYIVAEYVKKYGEDASANSHDMKEWLLEKLTVPDNY